MHDHIQSPFLPPSLPYCSTTNVWPSLVPRPIPNFSMSHAGRESGPGNEAMYEQTGTAVTMATLFGRLHAFTTGDRVHGRPM